MIPGMNQRKMAQAMKKMGIQQQEIDAKEVIIRTEDKELVFTNPSVSKVNMMGQNTYQIAGQPVERALSTEADITDEDIQTVIDQTGVSREEAEEAIRQTSGDLAEAIMSLSDGSA
jgi:nascent polypeptide-associated complex subunit alpha